MIIEAHAQGVSDIHIETLPGQGEDPDPLPQGRPLRTYLELPHDLPQRAGRAHQDHVRPRHLRAPQAAGRQDQLRASSRRSTSIELRVATIPTANGIEDVVLRILAVGQAAAARQAGPRRRATSSALQDAVERPYGLVLCVGPTGSGKTTTLHSALGHINTPERKIWTAEDPVEITQPGLRQVQVNPKIGWTFAKALRAFLRADPDVIMVGEMRDEETAHDRRSRPRSPATWCSPRCTPTARPRPSPACSTWAWTRSTSPTRCSRCWRSAWCGGCCPHCRDAAARRPTTRSRSCSTTTCTPSATEPPARAPTCCRLDAAPRPATAALMLHASQRLRKLRPHRLQGPRRHARADGGLARAAPPDPDRRARRRTAARGAAAKACARCARTASTRCWPG